MKRIIDMNEAKKTSGMNIGRIVSVFLITAMGAGLVYYWVQNRKLTQQVEAQYENADLLTAEIEDVEERLEAYQSDLQRKELSIEEKDEILRENEAALQEKEERIADLLRRNKITAEEAATLRGKVEQLNYYLRQYQAQVDTLKTGITERDERIHAMGMDADSLKASLHSKEMERIAMEIKLAASKRLYAHPFYFYKGDAGGAEAPETAFRNSQLSELKICFDVAENIVASKGPKEVYLQVFDPKIRLVKNNDGNWFFENGGENMEYSAMTTFEFQGEPTTVCLPFTRPSGYAYPSGNYTVVAYCEGFQIGTGFFRVK